jgi:hypothetical protein
LAGKNKRFEKNRLALKLTAKFLIFCLPLPESHLAIFSLFPVITLFYYSVGAPGIVLGGIVLGGIVLNG